MSKYSIHEGIGWFFLLLGFACCLFVLGWCEAGFPGLSAEVVKEIVP